MIRAGWDGGYGNYTCIDNGLYQGQGIATCYAHQSKILVHVGQHVRLGQVIGLVGETGAATGYHLHFEVRINGRRCSPTGCQLLCYRTCLLLTGYDCRMPREQGRKLIASNKKARHDYAILETFEAGIALTGTEVKSLRAGRASLVDGFAQESNGEIMLYAVHIPEYAHGTWTNHEPRRTRKLLLNRVEINKLIGKLHESGLTLVPLSMYFSDGWAKVELGLARGKKSYDKRHDLAERDANREITRSLGRRSKGMD